MNAGPPGLAFAVFGGGPGSGPLGDTRPQCENSEREEPLQSEVLRGTRANWPAQALANNQ